MWIYDVREFGARGDGATLDTGAIQAAIDACSQGGGGRVLLSPGCYLSGTIFLNDHVELHLAAGAVLRGSPNRADYNAEDAFSDSVDPDHYNRISPHLNVSNAHLVIAHRCRNVSVTGPGTVDGHSSAFFDVPDTSFPYRYKMRPVKRGAWAWRPGEMVWFCRCRHAALRDVTLINPPFFSAVFFGCEDVHIRGITIDVPSTTWNGDGLNLEACRNVTVSDCIIRSSDDSITVKSGETVFPHHRYPDGTELPDCENIVVSNCVLSSPTRGILLGVGARGRIRHVRFSTILIRETRTGIGIRPRYGTEPHGLYGPDGAGVRISDVHFSDMTLDCVTPFRIETGFPGADPTKTGIHDITCSRLHIRCSQKGELIGQPQAPIQRVRFRDIEWHVTDDPTMRRLLASGEIRSNYMAEPGQECAFLISDVTDGTFENIRLYWDKPDPDMRFGFDLRRCRDLEIRDVFLRPPRTTDGAALRQTHCRDIRVRLDPACVPCDPAVRGEHEGLHPEQEFLDKASRGDRTDESTAGDTTRR